MDERSKFILFIAVAAGGILLLVGGPAALVYLGGEQTADKEDSVKSTGSDKQNSWFNGSRYINSTEQWAYIDLTFPVEYTGLEWNVSVYGVGNNGPEYIYSMDSEVNSSVNGVKLNLDNAHIQMFRCFDIRVSVEYESQTQRVCLNEFELR